MVKEFLKPNRQFLRLPQLKTLFYFVFSVSSYKVFVSDILFILLLCVLSVHCQWGWSEKKCVCTSEYQPICASDMRRYKNICSFECKLDYIERFSLPRISKVDCKLLPPTLKN